MTFAAEKLSFIFVDFKGNERAKRS
jgi:hypothetical protein